MKPGDMVRADFKGKHYEEMDWEPYYSGVLIGEAPGSSSLKKRWKILITDSDGTGIGAFSLDHWKVTVIL